MASKLKYITAVVLYGTIGMLLHFVNLPSEVVVLCRGLIGTATILIIGKAGGHRIDFRAIRKNLKILLLSGVCLGLNWIFLFAAYRTTTVAIASLLNYTAPIIVLIVLAVWNRQKPGTRELLCVLAALIGIVLVSGVLSEDPGAFNRKGIALGMAAAAGFVGVVLCNRNLHEIDSIDRSIVQLFVSAVVVFPYVLFMNHGTKLSPDLQSVILVLILGIVHTGVAYIFYFAGMAEIPVESVAILGYLEPVLSILTSALILKEKLTFTGIIGAVLILGAAIVNELSGIRRPETPQTQK